VRFRSAAGERERDDTGPYRNVQVLGVVHRPSLYPSGFLERHRREAPRPWGSRWALRLGPFKPECKLTSSECSDGYRPKSWGESGGPSAERN
jgi:hypothetical protein